MQTDKDFVTLWVTAARCETCVNCVQPRPLPILYYPRLAEFGVAGCLPSRLTSCPFQAAPKDGSDGTDE